MRIFKCKYRNFLLVVEVDGKQVSVMFTDGVARVDDEKIAEAVINSLPYKRGEIFEWGNIEKRINVMSDHATRKSMRVTPQAITSVDLEKIYVNDTIEIEEKAEKIVEKVRKEVKKGRKRK